MTTHFIDITVIPDLESSAPQLMGALHDNLHLALVQEHRSDIGVSFPGYSSNPRSIGGKMRLHASKDALGNLIQTGWLKGMRDHVRVTGILSAPTSAPHRTVARQQFKTSAERLRRRRMSRKGETAEEAARAIPATMERRPMVPFLRIRSRSTQQAFCLFIRLGPLVLEAVPGKFNTHGLSATATIPWF